MLLFVLLIVLAIAAVGIYIWYRFLRTLRDLLRAVSSQNRKMEPGLVWLNFIPLFNLAWMFVTVVQVRASARAEFAYKGVRQEGGSGFGVGMAYAVLGVVSEIVSGYSGLRYGEDATPMGLSALSGLVSVASLVCWIVYWIKAAALRDALVSASPMPGSAASPVGAGYQPSAWQLPPTSGPVPPVQAQPGGPWLSGQPSHPQQSSPSQPAGPAPQGSPQVPGQIPMASQGTSAGYCPYCGAPYQGGGGDCRSCGRPVPGLGSQ